MPIPDATEHRTLDLPGFGLPVSVTSARVIAFMGEEVLDLEEGPLNARVVRALLEAPFRWTGSQIRVIRHGLSMPKDELAEALGLSSAIPNPPTPQTLRLRASNPILPWVRPRRGYANA